MLRGTPGTRIQNASSSPIGDVVRHQSATAHELARVGELAGLPGEVLARLGERMTRADVSPGGRVGGDGLYSAVLAGMLRGPAGLLRPGDTFSGAATAVTPATVASCDQAAFDETISAP
jgi:hypothetical protein